MEYTPTLRNFGPAPTADEVSALLEKIGPQARRNCRTEVYKRCFGCIDLTSLGATDSRRSIGEFTRKAIELPRHFPEAGSVASICVYPVFVETVGLAAGDSKMAITSVSGGFPSSQTYLEVKMLETAMAIENGADEIDIVISIGEMLDGEYDLAGNEIETLRAEIGDDAILKVILESGTLSDPGTDPQGGDDCHGGGRGLHQDLDRQKRHRRDARGCRGHVPRDPPVRRKNRP